MLSALVIGAHLGSVHIPARDYNNVNPGLYVMADAQPVAGFFYNSLRRPTFYVGGVWRYGPVRMHVALGTGYRYPVVPLVSPGVELAITPTTSAALTWVPRLGKLNDSNVFHITLERKF